MTRSFSCLMLFSAACVRDPIDVPETCGLGLEPYAADPSEFLTVDLWVEDDPDLPAIDAKEGCELWLPKGVQCRLVPNELLGKVRVYAAHEPCREAPEGGGYVLATAESNGRVRVFVECLRELFEPDGDGGANRQVLRLIVGHEVGHETGMWWHVPEDCAEAERSHPEGGPLCGEALMNPSIDPNTCFVTRADAYAFDLRDPSASPIGYALEAPDCVLTYAP